VFSNPLPESSIFRLFWAVWVIFAYLYCMLVFFISAVVHALWMQLLHAFRRAVNLRASFSSKPKRNIEDMVRVLNVAEKNDAAKTLAGIMSGGRFRKVSSLSFIIICNRKLFINWSITWNLNLKYIINLIMHTYYLTLSIYLERRFLQVQQDIWIWLQHSQS
jgi:hypothetical protein